MNDQKTLIKTLEEQDFDTALAMLKKPSPELITAINDVNAENDTALSLAVALNQTEIVLRLLNIPSINPDLGGKCGFPLITSIRKRNGKIFRTLMRCSHINVNIRDIYRRTPLMYLVEWGDVELFRLLCKHPETDVTLYDVNDKTVLDLAIAQNEYALVGQLFHYKEDKICLDNIHMLLAAAIRQGCVENVRYLLKFCVHDIDINFRIDGSTYLILAAEFNHPAIAKLLLSVDNIDILAQNDLGQTASDIAAEHHDTLTYRIIEEVVAAEGLDAPFLDEDDYS